jgi:hypothetical protein
MWMLTSHTSPPGHHFINSDYSNINNNNNNNDYENNDVTYDIHDREGEGGRQGGRRWAAVTAKGPNDAFGVVWAIGEFFTFLFRVFLILIHVLLYI